MRQSNAHAVMAHLHAGGTFRDAPVSGKTIREHGKLNLDWIVEARRLAILNGKSRGKIAIQRRANETTHCMRGHLLSGDNVRLSFRQDGVRRNCRACAAIAARRVYPMTAEQVDRATNLLQAGVALGKVYGQNPGSKGYFVANRESIKYQCSIDPVFDKIVSAARSRLIVLPTPAVHDNRAFFSRCASSDLADIRRMIPTYLSPHARDDLAQDIMVALLEGRIDRAGIRTHLRKFLAIHNRDFPTKFAKFGDADLVSLDEAMFASGKAARGEFVSEGLWA